MSQIHPHESVLRDAVPERRTWSEVSICGLRIAIDRSVTMDADDIAPDASCAVLFGAKLPERADWYAAAGWQLSADGRQAVIPVAAPTSELRAMQVRQVAPFAAAVQGKLTLHASCVAGVRSAFAFVGESGAGKSTFAATLQAQGWHRICDDLLPVRDLGGAWTVPAAAGPRALAGIYFVERGTAEGSLTIEQLPSRDALTSLLRHGFGELHAPRVWQHQFEGYARISKTVPCHRLVVPHDFSRLPEFAKAWADLIPRDSG